MSFPVLLQTPLSIFHSNPDSPVVSGPSPRLGTAPHRISIVSEAHEPPSVLHTFFLYRSSNSVCNAFNSLIALTSLNLITGFPSSTEVFPVVDVAELSCVCIVASPSAAKPYSFIPRLRRNFWNESCGRSGSIGHKSIIVRYWRYS